jgi:hypothetical protein
VTNFAGLEVFHSLRGRDCLTYVALGVIGHVHKQAGNRGRHLLASYSAGFSECFI